ncbi:MAG: hypothetical protein P4N59_20145 [Negativicutes bacterium]|nr:hypothetical protein [Negativicutes bacterium]
MTQRGRLNKYLEKDQVQQILLTVDRGLADYKIADWIEESLRGTFGYQKYQRLVTVYSDLWEEVYANIFVRQPEVLCQRKLLERLSSPPLTIIRLKMGWA